MASPYAQFETNDELETGKGVELEYNGFSITVNRAGGSNKKYQALLAEKLQPHRKAVQRGTLSKEIDDKIYLDAFAEGVVVGWKNVTDRAGKKTPYSVDACKKLFNDLPDLFLDVVKAASDINMFLVADTEGDSKN